MLTYLENSITAITGITETAILSPISQLIALFFVVACIYLLFNIVFNKHSTIKTAAYLLMLFFITVVVLNANGITLIKVVETTGSLLV